MLIIITMNLNLPLLMRSWQKAWFSVRKAWARPGLVAEKQKWVVSSLVLAP